MFSVIKWGSKYLVSSIDYQSTVGGISFTNPAAHGYRAKGTESLPTHDRGHCRTEAAEKGHFYQAAAQHAEPAN